MNEGKRVTKSISPWLQLLSTLKGGLANVGRPGRWCVRIWWPRPSAPSDTDQLFGPRSIETGCQRRSFELIKTAGFTQLIGHLPLSTIANSRPTCRLRAGSKRADADAV